MTVVDTVVRVVTPEGISFDLHPAGPLPRLAAFLLDALLAGSVVIVLWILAYLVGLGGVWVFLLLSFVVMWFYMVIFEMAAGGRTPGKRTLGLQVVQRDGTPPRFGSSLLRNLLRFADYFCGLGLLVPLFSDGFRRIGDLAAGTLVIYVPAQQRYWKNEAIPEAARPRPPERLLDDAASRALVEFARRRGTLGPSLRRELAEHALPLYLLEPERVEDAEATLVSIAAWCSGFRG